MMPTSSFDQDFVITDPEVAKKLIYELDNAKPVIVPKVDIEAEERKACELLKKRFKKQ